MASSSRSANIPWLVLRAELVGTAALVLVGLSLVILMFGEGGPIPGIVPSEGWRRLITGFLFGTTGALIALSPVGERSGAHINPIVTLAFRLMGKLDLRTSLGYVVAQLAGAILGALPLLAWGAMGRSVSFGATVPGEGYGVGAVLLGEVITTFAMVTLLCLFLAFRRIRPFTPAIFPRFVHRHGVHGVADLGNEHQPGAQPGTGGHLRTLGGVVDLLDRAGDRQCRGLRRVQCPRETDQRLQSYITSTATATGCFARRAAQAADEREHRRRDCLELRPHDQPIVLSLMAASQRYHCNRAPIRTTRGAVIAVGRSQELPEVVVSICAALVLNMLYTSKNPMTRTDLMRNVFWVRTSTIVMLGVRLAAIGSALMVALHR